MPDYKENNQQRDHFSQYIQQQLRGHQLPPDEHCWDEIGQRLRRRRNRLLLTRSLYMAGAAIFALLLLVNIPTNEGNAPSQHSEVIEEFAMSEVKVEKSTDSPVVARTEVKVKPVIEIIPANKPEAKTGTEMMTKTETEIKTEAETDKERETPIVNEKKKKTELPILPDKRISSARSTKQKRNWQMGAGLMAMGSTLLTNEDDLVYDQNSPGHIGNGSSGGIPEVPGYDNIQLQPDDCDDISYNLPLSFGITVRKELSGKIAVETGLVYTYLSTNLRKERPNTVKGKLALHYLGIPVNLIVDLWDSPKWNVYASAGVMVEKGLRSVYTQHIYRASAEEKATLKTSIHGLQWSLNGAVGISYRLQKDWSLYAEPRVSYFFDNNQPLSLRIENPFSLGFGLGVRFNF